MDKHKHKIEEQEKRKKKVEIKSSKVKNEEETKNGEMEEEEEQKADETKNEAEVEVVDKLVEEAKALGEGAMKKKLEAELKKKVRAPSDRKVDFRKRRAQERYDLWEPRTRLGNMVRQKEVTNMADALATGFPIREPEIVDVLLPDLEDEVLDVNMVQRMTDSGRRVRFAITAVVGNMDGYVGLGQAKGKEVGPTIRKAIDNAKMNIIGIKRGCGSWECGCGTPHSFPFKVDGKCGSIKALFKPAPRGIDLAVGDVAKHILRMAGIKDAWGFTTGKTRTTVNYAQAVFHALERTSSTRVSKQQEIQLKIIKGDVGK